MTEFTCALCLNTFDKINDETWNNFKASEEFLNLCPEAKNDPTDSVCDDCYDKFKKWFADLSREEKRKMREDFFNDRINL